MQHTKILMFFLLFSFLFSFCSEENFNDIQKKDYHITKTVSLSVPYTHFQSFDFDKDNNLWMLTTIADTSVILPPYSSYLPVKQLLIMYDGQNYFTYDGLPGIRDFFIDSNNNLWIYNSKRVSIFDKIKNIGSKYIIDEEGAQIEKVHVDSENQIWIEGNRKLGLLKYNGIKWKKQYCPDNYTAFCIASNGETYFATRDKVVIKYNFNEPKVLGLKRREDLFKSLVRGIQVDELNRVWAGIHCNYQCKDLNAVLLTFVEGQWICNNPVDQNGNEILQGIEFMLIDKKGKLWIESRASSNMPEQLNVLSYLDGNEWHQFQTYKKRETVVDYAYDVYDNLWFLFAEQGIVRMNM